ncbi:hypothetical protein JCM11251_007193 [Rhodosporidiobolus azoricus]
MDDIAELQGFIPRPSTSKQPPSSSFSSLSIDPALAGPGPASQRSRRQTGGGLLGDEYWDGEEAEGDDYYSGEQDGDSDDEDETDAEEEFAATQRGEIGVRQGRKSAGGIVTADGTVIPAASLKGKERAVDQDSLFGFDDEEDNPEDLTRLITAFRDSNAGSGGAAALEREFDRSIAYELDGFDPDLIEDMSVGIKGRKRRKGVGRGGAGRRSAADVEPSPEVKRLLSIAAESYSQGHLLEAIEQLSEVVRIDPIIRSSWYTLATIYEELEDREKALQCKIVATHLMGAKKAAADWVELGRESRDLGLLHQAIYCFTQAVKANKDDVDAMWDRAILLKLSGATTMAIRAFVALLSLLPHDPGVLRELSPLLAQTSQYHQATTLLLSAFAHYRTLVPLVTPHTVDELQTYGYGDLETLADFLLLQKNYAEVVRVVRQGVRWLQGREKETGWDAMEDDREYDEERKVREGWEKGNTWFELEPTYELDVRLRSRLGLARLGMGWVVEAQRHFEYVVSEDVAQFPELFGAIGDAYYERGMYDAALDVFQLIAENEETNGPTAWFKIAQCHLATGDLDEAKECYENVVAEEPENIEAKLSLAKVLEQLNEPARALQLIKDVISLREAQIPPEDVNPDGSTRRRRRPFYTKEEQLARRTNREDAERARHAEFQLAFSRLSALDASVQAGDDEATQQWLEIASRLVDSFRSTKQLFPQDPKKRFMGVLTGRGPGRRKKKQEGKERDIDADADQMADRLEQALDAEEVEEQVEETSFRGLEFDDWVAFILKYCFTLVRSDDIETAAEVIIHVREASVMRQSQSRQQTLRLGMFACYLYAGMHTEALKEYRWLFLAHPNQTEPLRLLCGVVSQGQAAVEAWNNMPLQKYVLRVLKSIHGQAFAAGGVEGEGGDTSRSTSPVAVRKGPAGMQARGNGGAGGVIAAGESDQEELEEGDEPVSQSSFKATKLSPLWYTFYGNMLNISQSHQIAIIYLLRAYELDKKQPLINLAIASAYLQRAMSRKTDNRQHQIAQAFAFLDQYRRLRGPGQEAEYNLARAFHHLGIQGHAVKHYENVLRMPSASSPFASASFPYSEHMAVDGDSAPPRPPQKNEKYASADFRKTAAYNLMTLYAMSNLPELARGVAERWLAV